MSDEQLNEIQAKAERVIRNLVCDELVRTTNKRQRMM